MICHWRIYKKFISGSLDPPSFKMWFLAWKGVHSQLFRLLSILWGRERRMPRSAHVWGWEVDFLFVCCFQFMPFPSKDSAFGDSAKALLFGLQILTSFLGCEFLCRSPWGWGGLPNTRPSLCTCQKQTGLVCPLSGSDSGQSTGDEG